MSRLKQRIVVGRAFLAVSAVPGAQSSLAQPRILLRMLRDIIFRKTKPDTSNPFALSLQAPAQHGATEPC